MAGLLDGKVTLVTGAGGGIGRATALVLARAGARVLVSDISTRRGEETAQLVGHAGGEAEFCKADVSAPRHRLWIFHISGCNSAA
jgi:NAD(P)-dependent dehydrogenase (short-subunit alcohol dehydrogenase family)